MRGKLSILPQDSLTKRLGTDQLAAFLSPSRFSAYVEIANGAAELLTKDVATLQAFAGNCAISNTDIGNNTCVDSFIKNFGLIVFRKPVSTAEVSELKTGVTTWKEIIGRILLHPRFLFHFEREGTLVDPSGVYQLTPFELEAKLCAVFWKSLPDLQGLRAASSGDLQTPSGLDIEVKRILASPKAQDTLWIFYQQWFNTSHLPTSYDINDLNYRAFKDPLQFGQNGVKAAALQDGKDFLNYITWTTGGKLEDIFRSPLIFTTDSNLAAAYGVTARSDSSMPPIVDQSGHYKGILTRAMINAQNPSVNSETNHILRGVFIGTNLLGMELGTPANFADQNMAANLVPAGASTRTEVTVKTAASSCIGCHSTINPPGFALAHYDTLGRYAIIEKRFSTGTDSSGASISVISASNPIDSQSTLTLHGKSYVISDAPSLVDALFNSESVYVAFAKYYFRFAFGHLEDSQGDQLMIDSIHSNLKTKSIVEVLKGIATHPDFARARAAN